MKLKEAVRKYEWVLIPLILVVGSFFGGSFYGERKTLSSLDSKCDTVTKVVTVWKDFPQPVKTAQLGHVAIPSVYFLTDTITRTQLVEIAVHDSIPPYIYLPKEQKFYSEDEGRLRLWVSGVDPSLDRYELDRLETTVTETYKPPARRWGLGLYAGVGGTFAKEQSIIGSEAGLLLKYQSPKRWGFDLLGGYSATFMSGQFVSSPHVRVKVSYDLITW